MGGFYLDLGKEGQMSLHGNTLGKTKRYPLQRQRDDRVLEGQAAAKQQGSMMIWLHQDAFIPRRI